VGTHPPAKHPAETKILFSSGVKAFHILTLLDITGGCVNRNITSTHTEIITHFNLTF
jgi:hypothetical protein